MNTLKISYYLAMAGFIGQFVLLGFGTFDRADIEITGAYDVMIGLLWTAIKGIPWLVLIPGLIMNTKNIMAWMSYVCLVYFIIWMLSAFGAEQSNLATIGVIITLIQFVSASLYTRLFKRQ